MMISLNRIYQHFKDKLYFVYDITEDSETGEKRVSYQALYGSYKKYSRTLRMFTEKIPKDRPDNVTGQRRRFVEVMFND